MHLLRDAAMPAALFLVCSWAAAQDAETFSQPLRGADGRELARISVADGGAGVRYELQRPDGTWTDPVLADYTLQLRYQRFDPQAGEPAVPSELAARSDNRLFVVQYHTQGLEGYRDQLRRLGAQDVLFLANHANVYRMDAGLAAAVGELPFVRAVVPFHPAYKLEAPLRALLLSDADRAAPVRVHLLTTTRGAADQEAVANFVLGRQGAVDERSEETHLMAVTVRLTDLPALCALNAVQWVDRWSAKELDMDIAREFHGMNHVESLASVTGQGLRVEVMDGGTEPNHPDLQNYAVHGSNSPSAHGTATSGIVVGSGANNPSARGALPQAFLAIADYATFSGGSRYAHTAELVNPALSWQCVLQSNSWGNSRTTQYSSISQDMDLILFDHARISVLQSQSNAGNQDSRPQAWAKNIISVGGIRHGNSLTKADDSWNFGASIGPAADGRIKPDLASFYDSIFTTDQVGSAGYSSSNYTSSFGGTSGATPVVAGMLGGFYELWHDGAFGNPNAGATAFDNAPNNTTAKAVLINSASQWAFSGSNADLTRTHQGWGHPDLQRLYDGRSEMLVVDESVVLANLQSQVHSVNVAAGTPELKVTMVYRDPPGTTSSSLHRINNLDLRVTSPSGAVYWGNNGLRANMHSTTGGSANTVDTVENVFVAGPESGAWSVEVIAAELNQDSHTETGALDCDYALVVSGVNAAPPQPTAPASPSNLGVAGQSVSSIQITWTDNSFNEDAFELERSSDGVSFGLLVSLPAGSTSYLDVGLPTGSTWHYRVRATNAVGPSGYAGPESASTLAPPTAPSGLQASAAGSNSVQLSWNDNSNNENGFDVERSTGGASFALIAQPGSNSTSYADNGVTPGVTYTYRVRARNAAGTSAYSNVAQATTSAFTDLVASSDAPKQGVVTGDYTRTHSDDDVRQSIREVTQGRRNSLEHEWVVSGVPSDGTRTLYVQAHHSVSPDGDDFVVQVRVRNRWQNAATISKTVDDNTYQTWVLPARASGDVRVRVIDTDSTRNATGEDTLFVDHLFVRLQ